MPSATIIFTAGHFEQMMAHVLADVAQERCGLLAGRAGRVMVVLPVPNALNSPAAYQMNGAEFAQAMAACDFDPLGIFHSHPAGPPTLSPADIAQAAYPDSVYVIIALNQSPPSARAFRIAAGRANEITLVVEPSPCATGGVMAGRGFTARGDS